MKVKVIIESVQVRSDRISFCFPSSILTVMWQIYELGRRGKELRTGIVQARDHGTKLQVLAEKES